MCDLLNAAAQQQSSLAHSPTVSMEESHWFPYQYLFEENIIHKPLRYALHLSNQSKKKTNMKCADFFHEILFSLS